MEKPKISTEKLKNNSSVEQTILKSTFLMPGESAIGSKDVKVTLTPTTPVSFNYSFLRYFSCVELKGNRPYTLIGNYFKFFMLGRKK